MHRFEGRVALVTGAATGIGKAIAVRLVREGAKVVLTDLRDAELRAVAEEIGSGLAVAVPGSITVEADIQAALNAALTTFGRLDVLVNNAAFTLRGSLADCSPADWDREIEVTLRGPFLFTQAVLPTMVRQRGGAIVNIGSVGGMLYTGNPAYGAAKAGLLNLTQAVAIEYGRHGVRANLVSPGTVPTEAPTWVIRRQKDPAVFDKLTRWYPIGRVGRPEDIAAAVAYLASDDAGFVTGANLVVDGGLTAGKHVMIDDLTLERGDAGAPAPISAAP
jgi:meso-butanediol dehydrogenase/(S,S)-butanediol dehydrogenase/diacetyl reductase